MCIAKVELWSFTRRFEDVVFAVEETFDRTSLSSRNEICYDVLSVDGSRI